MSAQGQLALIFQGVVWPNTSVRIPPICFTHLSLSCFCVYLSWYVAVLFFVIISCRTLFYHPGYLTFFIFNSAPLSPILGIHSDEYFRTQSDSASMSIYANKCVNHAYEQQSQMLKFVHNNINKTFFPSEQVIVGPNPFEAPFFQPFKYNFCIGQMSLLHLAELKQSGRAGTTVTTVWRKRLST